MAKRRIEDDTIMFYDGATQFLTIKESDTENGILLTLVGELRGEVSHDLLDELVSFVTVGVKVVVDCEKVTYIAPSNEQVFLDTQHKIDDMKKGDLTIRNLPPNIYQEFHKNGTPEVLKIEL